MATQTVIGSGVASLTGGFFQLRNALTNALVASAAATETAAGSTIYTAAFTDQPAAIYRLVLVNGSSVVQYVQWVELLLATGTYVGYEVPATTPATTPATGSVYAVVERSVDDTKPITFSWPVSGATITATVSKNNAAYGAVAGALAFLRSEGGKHYYTIAYNAADRPTAEGTARYNFVDGTYTKYVTLRVEPASDMGTAFAELGAVPAATSSLKDKLTWLFMWARNKSAQSTTERKLFADNTTTVVSTETVSDNGTTFTKGEAS